MADAYHHGNLREAILDRARAIIADEGVDALSLRAVASELKVSHAAPRHHFASKQALLTAIAAEGFADLADRLAESRATDGSFLAAGVAYVRFALDQPAAFAVMFTPTLLDHADPALSEAAARALGLLHAGAAGHGSGDDPDAAGAALAGWSLAHGFAGLVLSGGLAQAGFAARGDDILALAERALSRIVRP